MVIIAFTLSIFEIIVLFAGLAILGITLYFFIRYYKSLRQTFETQTRSANLKSTTRPVTPVLRTEKDIFGLHEQLKEINQRKAMVSAPLKPSPEKEQASKKELPQEDLTTSLRATIAQQQNILSEFLKQVEELENEGKQKLVEENEELQKEITNFERKLEKKNTEILELKNEMATAIKMTEKIDEVYKEFEQLQHKMQTVEKQAHRANILQMELEDTRQAYEQVYNDLARKTEKLDDSVKQNQRMKQEMDALEDKLADANLQRQQLQKKVQFLQDMNTDMQSMTETNKKLQTELRRIGELESMLNLIAEERDHLLHKKS